MATLAELAAESALEADRPSVVTSLDIRFLNRVKVGPVRARARPLVRAEGETVLAVSAVDAGNGDRPVAYATTRCLPLGRLAEATRT